jgi:hypothetical protein
VIVDNKKRENRRTNIADGSNTQHVRWKLDFNSFIRAVLPAGPAVPALIRIFHVGDTLTSRGFHVYGIGRANGIAQTTAGTFIRVKNRGHFLSSIEKSSSFIVTIQAQRHKGTKKKYEL